MDRASPEGSVTLWLKQLKAGDSAAAKPLWDGYFARLVALARERLHASRSPLGRGQGGMRRNMPSHSYETDRTFF